MNVSPARFCNVLAAAHSQPSGIPGSSPLRREHSLWGAGRSGLKRHLGGSTTSGLRHTGGEPQCLNTSPSRGSHRAVDRDQGILSYNPPALGVLKAVHDYNSDTGLPRFPPAPHRNRTGVPLGAPAPAPNRLNQVRRIPVPFLTCIGNSDQVCAHDR